MNRPTKGLHKFCDKTRGRIGDRRETPLSQHESLGHSVQPSLRERQSVRSPSSTSGSQTDSFVRSTNLGNDL